MSDQKKLNEKETLNEELDELKLMQEQREFIESMLQEDGDKSNGE